MQNGKIRFCGLQSYNTSRRIFFLIYISGIPQCTKCQSTKFKAKNVSADFLKKLKIKPGIGRPRRYPQPLHSRSPSPIPSEQGTINKDETITMEKLFQLPSERLQEIFEEASRRKLAQKEGVSTCRRCKPAEKTHNWNINAMDSCDWLVKKKSPMREVNSSTSMCSRKPLNCPHKPCNKIIAMSSFHTHFKHEHTDIPRYSVDRGKELEIQLNTEAFEFNTTFCLGMVTIYEVSKINMCRNAQNTAASVARKFAQRLPLDTFWIMVSGSSESRKSHAYMLFWLFTNNDQFYNCTMEVASQKEKMCYSTFCSVNSMYDSHEVKDVAQRLNCLYITYGAMESILSYGPKPKFRLTLH